jgi:hypothetical protein
VISGNDTPEAAFSKPRIAVRRACFYSTHLLISFTQLIEKQAAGAIFR